MHELLKAYITEALAEISGNPRVGQQLRSPDGNSKEKSEEEKEDMEEMTMAGGGIAGFTAPLGASNLDMGKNPVKPGGRVKKRKKTFVRWK
jgi:hypothetical protein